MGLIKYLLLEITDAKKEALRNIYNKKYFNFRYDEQKTLDLYNKSINSENTYTIDSIKKDFEKFKSNTIKNKDKVFEIILSLDTTPNNTYTQWLITKGLYNSPTYVVKNNKLIDALIEPDLLEEDAPRIKDALSTFDLVKKRKNFKFKDINQINSLDDLFKIIKPYIVSPTDNLYQYIVNNIENDPSYKDGLNILYEDDEWLIVQPTSEKSACLVGAKSEWCTSWGKYSHNKKFKDRTNYFNQNYNEGDYDLAHSLTTFINKNEGSENHYQILLSDNEIQDIDNSRIDFEELYNDLSDGAKKWVQKMFHQSDDLIDYAYNIESYIEKNYTEIVEKDNKLYAVFDDITELVKYWVKDGEQYLDILNFGYFYDDYYFSLKEIIDFYGFTLSDEVVKTIKNIIKKDFDENPNEYEMDEENLEKFIELLNELEKLEDDDVIYFLINYKEFGNENIINKISNIIQKNINIAKSDADFNEFYNEIIDNAISNLRYKFPDYNEYGYKNNKDYMSYVGDKLYILLEILDKKTQKSNYIFYLKLGKNISEKEMIEVINEYANNKGGEYYDEEVELYYDFEEPRYGFSGDIDWEYANDNIMSDLKELL